MTSIVITVVGPDRPGLVRAISDKAKAFGANWADSLMANLAGQFAGIVHLQVPAENSAALMAALLSLESQGMRVSIAQGEAVASGNVPGSVAGNVAGIARRVRLELIGHDRPGIIHSISNQLAERAISIEKLQTQVVSGAMSNEEMFQMNALLLVPPGLDAAELRRGLEGIANELMVEITLDDATLPPNPTP